MPDHVPRSTIAEYRAQAAATGAAPDPPCAGKFEPQPLGGFACNLCGYGSRRMTAPPDGWHCQHPSANPQAIEALPPHVQQILTGVEQWDCVHRGEVTRVAKSEAGCGCSAAATISRCELHGVECTPRKFTTDKGSAVRLCIDCDDRTERGELVSIESQPQPAEVGGVSPQSSVAEMREAILAHRAIPQEWCEWPVTHAAELDLLNEAAADEQPFPEGRFSGRGIVIGAGGATFFACAWVVVTELRRLGCELPVELWHLGPCEFDPEMLAAAESLPGVRVVDASRVAAELPAPPRRLNGWELKPFAMLHSAFEQAIYMDADCVPARDPAFLFESPEFAAHGAVFWPDIPPSRRTEWVPPVAWRNCGMAYRDEVDFESGQLVIDKRRSWHALRVCVFMNEHSDWYYRFVFGDKSTWHLAWRKTSTEYHLAPPVEWRYPCLLQKDFGGAVLFQHACQGKPQLVGGEAMPSLVDPDAPRRGRASLAMKWNGVIYSWSAMSDRERETAEALIGRYDYHRIGFGARPLDLLDRGEIGLGSDRCEKRWSVRLIDGEPQLCIVGEAHKDQEIAMMLLRWGGESWRGDWQHHERGPVDLRPVGSGPLAMPPWWAHRPGTWDSQIFDNICGDNEYGLASRLPPDAVVIDVGAHVGSFAFACLRRGAARVHAYEPAPANFALLSVNLGRMGDRAVAVNRAIWDGPGWLQFTSSADRSNTGGGGCLGVSDVAVEAIGLDEAILAACEGDRRVTLLKLDCEGGEFPALLAAEQLGLVDFILGEYHEHDAPEHLSRGPYSGPMTMRRLAAHLASAGFRVEHEATEANLGHFWATRLRPGDAAPVAVSTIEGEA